MYICNLDTKTRLDINLPLIYTDSGIFLDISALKRRFIPIHDFSLFIGNNGMITCSIVCFRINRRISFAFQIEKIIINILCAPNY